MFLVCCLLGLVQQHCRQFLPASPIIRVYSGRKSWGRPAAAKEAAEPPAPAAAGPPPAAPKPAKQRSSEAAAEKEKEKEKAATAGPSAREAAASVPPRPAAIPAAAAGPIDIAAEYEPPAAAPTPLLPTSVARRGLAARRPEPKVPAADTEVSFGGEPDMFHHTCFHHTLKSVSTLFSIMSYY